MDGFALPHPDTHDSATSLHGAKCRFLAKMPTPNEGLLKEFGLFVKEWIKANLTPLSPDVDVSFETWLEEINHPRWRKEELRKTWDAQDRILDMDYDLDCESFGKKETYPEYKPLRWINARRDAFKCYAGPWIRAIEKEVFKLKWFIKKIPVADRPKYIQERLFRLGAKYFSTDFTTFEAIFTKELMENCEFQLYDYMLQNVPGGPDFCEVLKRALGGINKVTSKWFTIFVEAIRMSGEMSTSLGNGFTNLMLMLFLFSKAGCADVDAVVEGDDGLGVFAGNPPTAEMYAQLGCKIKIEIHEKLETASFCGIVYHPSDMINLVDFRETLVGFGWASDRYCRSKLKIRKMLLRCKALSLAYQYPGCPVLTALARYSLRVTRDVRHYLNAFLQKQGSYGFSLWEREQVLEAIKNLPSDENEIQWREPGINTRILAETLYGVSIKDQLAMENYLDSLHVITPLKCPSMDQYFHEHWKHYWDNYVCDVYLEYLMEPGVARQRPAWKLAT